MPCVRIYFLFKENRIQIVHTLHIIYLWWHNIYLDVWICFFYSPCFLLSLFVPFIVACSFTCLNFFLSFICWDFCIFFWYFSTFFKWMILMIVLLDVVFERISNFTLLNNLISCIAFRRIKSRLVFDSARLRLNLVSTSARFRLDFDSTLARLWLNFGSTSTRLRRDFC